MRDQTAAPNNVRRNIRDEKTNRLAEKLVDRMRSAKTAAGKGALRNELDRLEQKVPLHQRLRPLKDRVMSRASTTGLEADKAFHDALSGHGSCPSVDGR
jgi:antitoxin VapB